MKRSDKDLYSGLIRLHVLHHAGEQPIYGSWMIEELRAHGYEISPGTLYPMLSRLEKAGYLKSEVEQQGRRRIRWYRGTKLAAEALEVSRVKLQELLGELI